MRIADVMKQVRKTSREHGFESKGRELFCEKMLLIVSEISEALEEFRDGRELDEVYYDDHDQSGIYADPPVAQKPEGIPIEIADAVIRIFDFCEANGIDLEEALKLKMEYNETRPYKHNRQL